jgi:[glutamine synthetase] adenylyltransferase / [glutamine synthetase]-adenylyl-L-tyrosine phosphorylase
MPEIEARAKDPLASAPQAVRESLERVFAASDFVSQACSRDPQLLEDLVSSGDLAVEPVRSPAEYYRARAPRGSSEESADDAHAMAALRRWRQREMVRIAWRDLAGWATLGETLGELSAFADVAIETAYDHAWRQLTAVHGEPRSPQGVVQPLVIVGMGKLGGRELNFSSDVDLVFLYPEQGETSGTSPLANDEFFTRLGQALIRLLDARTAHGIVFRVDMRLRPFGTSGPLVASFASLEDYLERQGRDWERYAWIKARPITAPQRYAQLYTDAVRPFVYRRYLDYGVFESLREMKGLIEREVARRELETDVKLGPGGIREIEFVVQSLQLIRGGRDTRLQTTSLLAALARLNGQKLLSGEAVQQLADAYEFLRRLENRLQMLADEQTHRWPDDPHARARIARAMGASDGPDLAAQLERHRQSVSRHFRAVVFAAPARGASALIDLERDASGSTSAIEAAFRSLVERLREAGFAADAPEAARLLEELRDSALARKLDEAGRKRLRALLPTLVGLVGASPRPLDVLRRVLRILEAIGPRSAYFALLNERASARERLTELAAQGDFLADQIASYPLLLDELVDERVLKHTPTRGELAEQLALAVDQAAEDDPERQVEALRHFQQAATFHVAVADLSGRLPVMRVSDRLTEIAELILERAMDLAWRQTVAQFGVPRCGEGAARAPVQLCALGYGKLGGFELGYASDLDLVFLHDSRGEREETDGPQPIDNQQFCIRVVQRVVHLLTLHSAAGRLYEVDMRLRPSGKAGLLVTSLGAFADYQRHTAWTWEHQALLHARAVAGAPSLRAAVEELRMDVLRHHVRRDSLRDDIRAMRERMRRELSKADRGGVDLKQDAGGIADIEFLAQYWALNWARDHPQVAWFSDTIRELESVASANLVPQSTVDVLTGAYRAYRARAHRLSLERREPIVPAEQFAAQRAAVSVIWKATMGG